ncbi:MAG: RNA-binding domain-containing protein [Candidatus Thorarchaeota archaeon]
MAAAESGPVHLEMQASVHATEELDKVRTAMMNLFPQAVRSSLVFNSTKLRGHYHNPIIRLETQLRQRELIEQTLTSIGEQLRSEDRVIVARTFPSRVNKKGQIFLRLDKQEAYQGRVRIINRGDSIRLVVRFSGRKPSLSDLENLCRKFKLL